jgi:peptidoglycan-associated lipoprotein
MRIVTLIATAAGFGLLLSGCSTTPESTSQGAAKVEERGAAPGQPVQAKPIAGVDLTMKKDPAAALKDPGSILSKRSIYYEFDKFDVRTEYRGLVEAHAKYLRDNPSARMLIQGNADERGSREYNIGLGQRRSDGVKKMMTLLGVRENQIEAVSLGEEKPQDEGHSEAAWAKNRRSDILYSGEY